MLDEAHRRCFWGLCGLGIALFSLAALAGCDAQDKGIITRLPPPAAQEYSASPPPPKPVRRPPPVVTRRPPPPRPSPRPTPPVVSSRETLQGRTIVIDPGHGGKDPGAWEATSSPVPEKAIVLDVSLKVMELLRQRGATVVPTRTTDSYPSLEERADLAARTKTDLFVSIHADSAPSNPQASGTEVYIYTQASAQSERAAREVVAAFERAGFSSRGIKRRNLHVLREHPRPAILIECGFMTNRGDMRNLNKPAYRTRLAEAIADGIERSLR